MTNATQTQKFITSRTKRDHVFHTTWEVTTETLPGLPEEMKTARWFETFGNHITAVRRIKVRSNTYLPNFPESVNIPSHNWGDTYIEVETVYGYACIVGYRGNKEGETFWEVSGLILKQGRKNPAYTLGTWRKYGHKRGHGMAWLRAKHGQGLCKSPESGADICAGQAYANLAGKSY